MKNERELVMQAKKGGAAEYQLFSQYENLIHKHYHILRKQLKTIPFDRDDFYSEAYISFRKALKAVDPVKIEADDKWKFIGYFRFYLQGLRASIIREALKKTFKETPLYKTASDGEEYLITDDALMTSDGTDRIVDQIALDGVDLTGTQRMVLDELRKGTPKREIAAKLDVHPAMVTYHLKGVRRALEQQL